MSGILYLADVPAGGLDPFELYDRVTAEIDWTNVGDFRIVVLNASGVVVRRIVTNRQEYATLGQLWRRDVMPNIMETSARPIWREGWRIVFQQPTRGRYPPAELLQRFRDGGETHCVLTPIRTYYEAKLAAAAGDATRRKCQTSLARCAQLERQFRDGVPETCLEYVAKRLAVRIHLSDAFGNNERRYNDEDARNRIFKFRNVSFNHVQEMACLTEVETLSAAAMDAQLRMLKDGRSFYMYTQSGVGGVPTRIDCPLGRFALEDPDKTCFQAARDRYKLDGYAIDAQKEPLLARFLDAGLRVTSHAKFHAGEVFEDDPAEYKVIDLSRAYTRGTDAGPYFQGYLAGIGNVRRVDAGIDHLRAHPGIYSVDCIDLSGCNERLFDLATQLHLHSGTHLVLPSPELLWWWDHGVRFEIVGGAWGPVLDDIDWEGCGLLEKGTGPLFTGLSRYKVWCGQLGYSNRGRKNVYLPGDSRWAAVLANAGYHAHHYEGDGDICVRLPAAKTPELKHVFAFVTSYTRINVLNKLLEFDIQNVRGVMLDAIIYVGDDAVESDLWVRKESIDPLVLSEYGVDGWYGTHGIWAGERVDGFLTAAPTAITSPLTFLEGAGGSGKSHSVLADAGFRDILFAAPTWSLVCFMMRKYGVAGTTVHRLAGTWTEIDDEGHERTIKCRPYHEERQRYPSVVFVDEATMIDAAMLKRVCDVYAGKSQIILAGDIKVSDLEADTPPVWFQCRNRTRVFDPREVGCAIVSYAHDYRASGALVDLKRALRDAMLDVFLHSTADDPGDDEIDARDVAAAARSLFASQVCTAADCEAGYAKGDTILAGTHELADEWGVKLKDRDARYRVVSHTHADVEAAQRGEDVSLTGDIVDDKGDRNAVFALAFTIHSFQGKTFTGRTLWIDARRSWDYAMLYTAISRCQIISQIRIFFE